MATGNCVIVKSYDKPAAAPIARGGSHDSGIWRKNRVAWSKAARFFNVNDGLKRLELHQPSRIITGQPMRVLAEMLLRDHPNIYIWPPQLSDTVGEITLSPEETEDCFLRHVEIKSPFIWIAAEYRRKMYFGAVRTFSDPEAFDLLYQKLSNSIGRTIREIGNSEWHGQEPLVKEPDRL